jgi:DNA primase catalytic core
MSLHKLTAGDGYTYLTRQVAAHDATDNGHAGLADYYAQKGESPGRWLGAGLAGLDGVTAGEHVTEAQMLALFGEGRHPNAVAIEQATIAAGGTARQACASSKLGRAYAVYDGANPFQIVVARRFTAYNLDRGRKWDAPIPADERAAIRTGVGVAMFAEQYGRGPADARELSGFIARNCRQATTAVAGYDLTFSPVKSVSTLWAIAPPAVATQIEAAHDAAVADTIRYLEQHAAYTRRGGGGVRHVDVTGLIATAFTHRDSRAGDPDLHTHVAVSNKVQSLDRRWLALDGRVLYKAAVSASEHYNTRLEAELTDRLGVSFADRPGLDRRKRAVREIVGIDPRLIEFWSSRRTAIDARRSELAARFQRDHGRPPTTVEALHLAQQATLETREAKHEPRTFAEQRQAWRAQAEHLLGRGGLARMLAAVRRQHVVTPGVTEQWVAQAAHQTVSTTAQTRATWQVWHVRAEAQRLARAAGIGLADLDDAVERVVAAALHPNVSIPLRAPDPISEPAPLRRRDGTSMYEVAGSQLYTSTGVMEAERSLVAAAQRRDGRALTDRQVELALLESIANGLALNDLQAQMVRELATSGARVQLAIAPAGSGKTTAMRTLANAWTSSGGSVIGLAPSAVAAAGLRAEIQTRTDTLAKFTHVFGTRRAPSWIRDIDASTLVIIDEAGMAGTADLARAVDHVLQRGASVRLVGDDQQLASIAAGGVLRDIAESVGVVTLSQLMRFTDPAEGAATLALRAGDHAALGFYVDHDRVHVGDATTVADQAYAAWAADRANGLDSVMLAPTRELVSALNIRARADRLGATDIPPGREVTLGDGNQASAGDVIITRRNERTLAISATDWVKNGDQFSITDVHRDGSVTARHHDTRRLITLPAGYLRADAELGYACTVHTAQGITTDTCHTVAAGDEARQLLYVAMSRGRQANHVYLITAGDGDPHSMIKPDALFPATAVDIFAGILDRDQAQRSATTLAAELADPAILLQEAVARYHDALSYAAEHVLGPDRMGDIDTAADTMRPGLTDAPAWPTLRAHLALLAVDGHDPRAALTAAAGRDLDSASDPAAVLDWRLEPDRQHKVGGPLPWLPRVPAELRAHQTWGRYLHARTARITELAAQVATRAAAYTPTSAPPWATRLLDPAHTVLRQELAVWRAATNVADKDRRPTGTPQPDSATAAYQKSLAARVDAVLGDPALPARLWAGVVDRLDPRISRDPYWPELADRLAALDRAGIEIRGVLAGALRERHLPDEQPAAALWWRLARHLSPAALAATAHSGAATLRPQWTDALTDILGTDHANRVLADPAWPALVAAVNAAAHSGWQPIDVLRSAAELAHLDEAGIDDATVANALVWRVAMLADPNPIPADEHPAPDPVGELSDPPAPIMSPLANDTAVPAGPTLSAPSKDRLVELNEQAADFFAVHYPGSWAADTMRERLGTNLIDDPRFTPGCAPAGFTNLVDHLKQHGATDNELLAAGLAKRAKSGRLIDVFRDRLMLPIHGPDGAIRGFIGRRHPKLSDGGTYAGPKYLNTRQTVLFGKRDQLFGLHEGRQALAAGAIPVLVEGPLDALAITVATRGTHVGVAPLGTSFTDAQADHLKPYIGERKPGVIVATDADHAGQEAAERAYWRLVALGDNPAHVIMHDGADPAELLQHGGAQAVQEALAGSQPLATTLIARRLHDHAAIGPTATAEATVAATRAVADIIGALPPEHWLEHIETVTNDVRSVPGALHIAVIDAGEAWTTNPTSRSAAQIARIASQPQPERARVASGGPQIAASARNAWVELADRIDARLTRDPAWPALAATLSRARRAGYDVTHALPKVAATGPLPDEHPALELQYRVVADAKARVETRRAPAADVTAPNARRQRPEHAQISPSVESHHRRGTVNPLSR